MQWAGEPNVEEVLSDPIVRAVMACDRVDQEELRPLLQERDQAGSLASRRERRWPCRITISYAS